ncbi:MAG: NADH:flavin oxidoreductase [Chloroflexi bacterium]|nr:NADH:flavin oxidoreductase [Chloroflexota bacterium]
MSVLFEPGMIGPMSLKNRFVRSATAELLASDDGRITDQYLRAYRQLARGGVGLIVTGNYYVNNLGRGLPRMPVVDKDEIVGDLRQVAETVHDGGGKLVAQLNHGGRQCDPKILGTTPVGPSAIPDKLTRVKPREMIPDEVEDTISAFGEASRRVKEAGIDGVQIHAAHGYLVNQFLSSYTNRRKDKWGGSLENRMRFLIEVYQRIRTTVGSEYPVLVKINAQDFVAGGVTLEETIAVCQKLDQLGIDAIEVSGGIGEKGFVMTRGDIPRDLLMRNRNLIERILVRMMAEKSLRQNAHFEEAYFLSQAAAIKSNVNVPVIAVGGMRHRATMEDTLTSRQADFVSMSRPFIRQPNLVKQMEEGERDPITCTNCNRCTLEMVVHFNPMKCYESDKPE